MEFHDHEDLEESESEEEEEEMGFAVPPGYDSAARSKTPGDVGPEGGGAAATTAIAKNGPTGTVRYRECQKNHAVSIGGHAVDGCCEFLAAGAEGTLEAVICAACNCHRNFHRKEIGGEITPYQPRTPQQPSYHHQFSPYFHRAAPSAGYLHHHLVTTPPLSQHRPLALPPATSGGGGGFSREEEDVSNPSSSGGGGTRKRHRTRFTAEQKDKMLAFAERIGWRIQKHDESAVEQFCEEICIKRHVLKVWMHNNKHTLDRPAGF